jgi:F-type H+-transporting ATPase subunit epsilon
MAHPIDVEIVAADRKVFSGTAGSVTIPGIDGYFGVLSGHAPLISALGIGIVELRAHEGSAPQLFAVSGGFVEVTPEKVTLLADAAETAAEIDAERARLAVERAEARLRETGPHIDITRAQAALHRAVNRLRLMGQYGR